MYYSIWWFIAAVAATMVFIAYRFYVVQLEALHARNEALEQQVEQLHVQLDNSILREMKTNKEADHVKQMKQRLLGVINHEIRTPMNGIMGMSTLLAETPLNAEQTEYATTIRTCGESLLKTVNDILVNDILDFSKLERQELELESKDFDLRNCVEEILEMFATRAAISKLDLIYYIDENIPTQIIGDVKRLQQILMNLLENAVKFTPNGEISINVSSVVHGSNKPQLKFEMKDTGIGISEEQLIQLFKGIPNKKTKEKSSEASGLGLVVCKKLVELMGGTIEVKSHLGKGSSFIFTIPLIPGIKQLHNDANEGNLKHIEGKRILIIEDNSTQQDILMKQMHSWKMQPYPASTGKQALSILSQQTKFDLIMIDSNLPDLTGSELAKSIKDQHPLIPLILMNIVGNEGHKQKLFASIVSKPIRQNILRDRILEIFSSTNEDKKNEPKKLSGEFANKYPLRILIAEDNVVNQKLAIKMLNKLGYQPDLATNGKEALEKVGHEHYDIILMDVQMPEMDGLEATRMIRTCLEVQPVIIALTANVMLGDRDDCMQAGMDDYLSKPIELNELLDQLEKWFLAIKNKRKISA
jgi:signal transduction histidine kinase/DNA-binding response OmpR family regulator